MNRAKFINLCWILLEHKCLYYKLTGSQYEKLRMSDKDYDALEKLYDRYADKYHNNNSEKITDMVGFNMNKPSCVLVYDKLKNKKRITKYKSILEIAKGLK